MKSQWAPTLRVCLCFLYAISTTARIRRRYIYDVLGVMSTFLCGPVAHSSDVYLSLDHQLDIPRKHIYTSVYTRYILMQIWHAICMLRPLSVIVMTPRGFMFISWRCSPENIRLFAEIWLSLLLKWFQLGEIAEFWLRLRNNSDSWKIESIDNKHTDFQSYNIYTQANISSRYMYKRRHALLVLLLQRANHVYLRQSKSNSAQVP